MKFLRVAQNLYRLKPGDTYYAIWNSHGQKQRKSLKTKNRQIANMELSKHLERLRGLDLNKRGVTFKQLSDDWRRLVLANRDLKPLARKDREQNLRALLRDWPTLATTAARDITPTDCERWRGKRLREISPQRLNNEIGTLRQIFDFAVEQGIVHQSSAAKLERVKVPRTQIAIPSRVEFGNIIEWLDRLKHCEAARMVELLGYTGLRLHEAACLQWEDIDFKRSAFVVTGGERGTKNRESRHVPLFPAFLGLLGRIPQVIGKSKILIYGSCRKTLAAACQALKLPSYTHHDFRHFFVSNAIEEGVDFKTIAAWVGHKDGGMLVASTYGHLRSEHSGVMAKRMDFTVYGQLPWATKTRPIQKTQ